MSALVGTRTILRAEILALRHRLVKRGAARLTLLTIFMVGAAIFIGGGAFSLGAGLPAWVVTSVTGLITLALAI